MLPLSLMLARLPYLVETNGHVPCCCVMPLSAIDWWNTPLFGHYLCLGYPNQTTLPTSWPSITPRAPHLSTSFTCPSLPFGQFCAWEGPHNLGHHRHPHDLPFAGVMLVNSRNSQHVILACLLCHPTIGTSLTITTSPMTKTHSFATPYHHNSCWMCPRCQSWWQFHYNIQINPQAQRCLCWQLLVQVDRCHPG